jgi:hypothetical protein
VRAGFLTLTFLFGSWRADLFHTISIFRFMEGRGRCYVSPFPHFFAPGFF